MTVHPEAYSAPLTLNADDDVVNGTEVNTRESQKGKILKGLSGSEDMACIEKSIRNLGDPVVSCT
jgi:hypothetical protein